MNDGEKKKNFDKIISLKETYPPEKALADYVELAMKQLLIDSSISYKKRGKKK